MTFHMQPTGSNDELWHLSKARMLSKSACKVLKDSWPMGQEEGLEKTWIVRHRMNSCLGETAGKKKHLLLLSSIEKLGDPVVLVVGLLYFAFHQVGTAGLGHRLDEGFTFLDLACFLWLNATDLIGDILQRCFGGGKGERCR